MEEADINRASKKFDLRKEYVDQFASEINEFSSQYGRENAHSYTATNLTESYSRYPLYGDFTDCYVMVMIGFLIQ
jgi:hypothetical protein